MNVYVALFSLWGLVILALVAILIYRSRLTGQETVWIPLTDDKREDKAIQAQIAIEKQVQKFTWPIRVLVILFFECENQLFDTKTRRFLAVTTRKRILKEK